jgi:acetoin utilization deacetylase AcuC-like enzyme
MLAVYYHRLFAAHLEGFAHPEQPGRVRSIMNRLETGPLHDRYDLIEPEAAQRDWIERIHDDSHYAHIVNLEPTGPTFLDAGDTVATEATPEAALVAAGATVQAARAVLDGRYTAAFCCVRPPGHHAGHSQAMGFCLFNNIAIAAADLIAHGGLERVAIVDWDVHHGNGTQDAFADSSHVQFISLHQYPYYPGTGSADFSGEGDGKGYTINLPMEAGAGPEEYLTVFDERVIPALEEFGPQFILISAGFDAHRDDPLAGMNLESETYAEMTRRLRALAVRHCEGRIVSVLEGGYNVEALAKSVEHHLTALIE